MADLNRVFLMGRLTFDPELRRLANGTAVTDLRLATSRSWPGRDGGERKEETLYIDVTVWDRQAETCCQYLRKGSGVHVEGFLKMDSWDDKTTGEKRTKIKVQADRVQFLDRREDSASGPAVDDGYVPPPRESTPRRAASGVDSRPANGAGRPPAPATPRRPAPSPSESEGEDEDIPF
jgi:single-strand DNA-binding protein